MLRVALFSRSNKPSPADGFEASQLALNDRAICWPAHCWSHDSCCPQSPCCTGRCFQIFTSARLIAVLLFQVGFMVAARVSCVRMVPVVRVSPTGTFSSLNILMVLVVDVGCTIRIYRIDNNCYHFPGTIFPMFDYSFATSVNLFHSSKLQNPELDAYPIRTYYKVTALSYW